MTTYKEAVNEAAAALARGEDAEWTLAQLTYENTSRRGERTKATHEKWSADVREKSGRRFSKETSWKYGAMWAERLRKKEDSTIVLSWTEEWYELIPRDQPEPMRARSAKTHVQEASPAEVAETVAEALKRPEVARAVTADDDSNRAITEARQAHDQEARSTGELKDPDRRTARHRREQADAVYRLVKFRNWLFRITPEAQEWDWSDDLQEGWIDAIEGVRGALDLLETAPDFDTQLEEMTNE